MSSDFMLTAEELRLRRRKRRRLVVVLVLLVALGLGGLFGGRPALHEIKAWQARRHARKAFALIEKEEWIDARKEATTAIQLWPNEPEAIRAVARFLSRTRQPQALEFWDQLAKISQVTPADLREEAAVALLTGDDARATAAIRALQSGRNGPVTAADQLLAAQLALRQGAPIDAHDAIQKVFGDAQAANREKLQAALLQLAISAGNDSWRDEAWSWLKKIAQEKDAAGLDALTVLAPTVLGSEKIPATFPMTAAELCDALEKHPLARAPQKLLAVDLKIHEHTEQRDALITEAIARWKDTGPDDLATLAAWLNGKGEFQRELDAIPIEKALQARDLFLQHVDALGGLGRWREIKQLLDRDTFPLDPVVQKMYLARCAAQLGEKAAAENNWQRAFEAARGDPGKLLTLASYAEKNGAAATASLAYDEAIAESPKLRPAHQGRLRIAQAGGETKKIHAVLADMLAIWPNDPAIQNDEAYTRLLLITSDGGTASVPSTSKKDDTEVVPPGELEAIEQLAAKLVEREPSSMPHRTLLALARLRGGKFSDALEAYAGIQANRSALTPSALAVHAAVLSANGHNDDAATEIREIDPTRLLPEEAALIQNIPR
jgi:tetratricopeptide (TPR) repeat protein